MLGAVAGFAVAMPSVARAQYNAQWVTGIQSTGDVNGMVLDFRSSPPTISCAAQMRSDEGSASWSDALTGDLVVYSNGLEVRTPAGLVVDGSGLEGNSTATETALFVPVPGTQAARLFVFSNKLSQVYASVIAVDRDNPAETAVEIESKNTLVAEATGEAIGAVAHADGATFWLVLLNADSDSIDAYHVQDDTIPTTPTASTPFAFLEAMTPTNRASIVFDVSRRRLVLPLEFMGIWVLDFDTATGVASSDKKIWDGSGYSAAFSPSANIVYFAAPEASGGNGWQAPLRQYDLIAEQETTLSLDDHAGVGLGPDGKVYSAGWRDNAWTVIDDPDVGGADNLTTLDIPTGCLAGFNISKQIDLSGTSLTPCTDDGPGLDSGCTERLPACDTSSSPVCVGCLGDEDCTDGSCDLVTKTCRTGTEDAGPGPDAGDPDAGAGDVDGGSQPADTDEDGCSCRFTAAPGKAWLWGLLIAAWCIRRRRAR